MATTQLTGTLGTVTLTAREDLLTRALIDAAIESGELELDRDEEWYGAGAVVAVLLGGAQVAYARFESEEEREEWIEGEGLELTLEAHMHFVEVEELVVVAA